MKLHTMRARIEAVSIDNWSNEFKDDIDKKLFKEIKKKWPFYNKILYLKDNKLMPESCYEFLRRVKNIRNKIHEDPIVYEFTEKDLGLFSIAHDISVNLRARS
jgi:hypothetical protein